MGHRTDVPMTGPSNFNELVPPFLHYKNVSKIFYELLRPIPTHAERPHDFKKNVIALPHILLEMLKFVEKQHLRYIYIFLCIYIPVQIRQP